MVGDSQFSKYARAKIEVEPHRLMREASRTYSGPYTKTYGDAAKKEAMDAGGEIVWKTYRIRNMELFKLDKDGYSEMQNFHDISKATIGLLVHEPANCCGQSFVDLQGTPEQVEEAEQLIIKEILKTYAPPLHPVILMPPNLCTHETRLPEDKVALLIGKNADIFLELEVIYGAWLQVDEPPAGGPNHERIVNFYGPKLNVFKAVSSLHSQLFEPGECPEAEKDLDLLLKEFTFQEMMEVIKSRSPQIVDLLVHNGNGKDDPRAKKQKNSALIDTHSDPSIIFTAVCSIKYKPDILLSAS